jgi:hypothetical protein
MRGFTLRERWAELVAAAKGGPGGHPHLVQLYEAPEFLADTVASYVGAGLELGSAALLITTAEHRRLITEALRRSAIDLEAVGPEHLHFVDAQQMLNRFMRAGRPDSELFAEHLGGALETMTQGGVGLRAYGEMVALLWAQGNPEGAIALEKLWNTLAERRRFSLLCAYPVKTLGKAHAGFDEMCAAHTHVLPSETFLDVCTQDGQLSLIASLQQKARVLSNELEAKRKHEEALELANQRLEQELAEHHQTEDQLREAVATRDEFFSIASHELRTPLTSLKMQLEMVRKKLRAGGSSPVPLDALTKAVEVSCRQTDRLAHLVENMLII